MRRSRGSGTVYREGPVWSIRYGSGPRRYETGFRTKMEAENRLALRRAEAMQRRLGAAADPKLVPTLAELAQPWLETREGSHAAGKEDASRWRKHLEPFVGHLRPDEVDTARIRALVHVKREEGLAPGTIRVCLSVLSSLYEDLRERRLSTANPCRGLPQSILRLVRSDHDPETTPFLERLADVRRVFLALPEPFNVAFALGALAGLRTGEVFTLRWPSVDLQARRILVREGGAGGRTKDREPRPVPILDALLQVLEPWRLRHKGAGRVIPPLRADGDRVDKHTPGPVLRRVLRDLGYAELAAYDDAWYAATRHTFASQWAMAGRPLRELQKLLGHSSIAITERYAHLAPDYWAPGVHTALEVDLRPGGAVAELRQKTVRKGPSRPTRARKIK